MYRGREVGGTRPDLALHAWVLGAAPSQTAAAEWGNCCSPPGFAVHHQETPPWSGTSGPPPSAGPMRQAKDVIVVFCSLCHLVASLTKLIKVIPGVVLVPSGMVSDVSLIYAKDTLGSAWDFMASRATIGPLSYGYLHNTQSRTHT